MLRGRNQMLRGRRADAVMASTSIRRLSSSIAWKQLGFDFTPTRSMVRYNWKDGSWDDGTLKQDFNLNIHALSNVMHYGQAIFEGLKAFHCRDGKVRVFNSGANAARLQSGCQRLHMPSVTTEMFDEAIDKVIGDNVDYVPPFGSGGSMYLRPFLFGHGAKLGLGPAPEYDFCIVGSPVGAYYKGGLQAIDALCVEGFDRAAPRGVGNIKAAGNYAPDVQPSAVAKEQGYPVCLYLDAKTNSYVEEFSTSNFIGIKNDGTLVTPTSDSILPSCTKAVLLQQAKDMGMTVEQRPVPWDEVQTFTEVAACGTAVVVTPIKSITRGGKVLTFEGHATLEKLYNAVTSVQTGEADDPHGYTRVVCERAHEES
jgi:branched-chain amino acid aminotransferase